MRYRRSADGVGSPDASPASCSPTAATTSTSTDACSAPAASARASPAAESRTLRAGQGPMGRRTRLRLATRLQTATHPLRTAR
jgi:hypothetical protein